MAWFGDGLSSLSNLKGQITSFTKEVLSEGIVEETDERTRELNEANERYVQLQQVLNSKDAEISLLRRQNCELQKAVVELNARPRETNDGSSVDDEGGGGFFWDPPSVKNREATKNPERAAVMQERLSQATMRIRELEDKLKLLTTSTGDRKDEIKEGHQKAELMRAKQDMVNRIIQIGEKSRDAERNFKKLPLDESMLINDFRAAISKLDSHEQSAMIASALKALNSSRETTTLNEEIEKSDVGEKREKFDRPRLESVSLVSHSEDTESHNGIAESDEATPKSNIEIQQLHDKIKDLTEANEFLTSSLDELDKEHAQSLDTILAVKDQLSKKHETLQKAYEQLYVECNEAQTKLQLLESRDAVVSAPTAAIEANNNSILEKTPIPRSNDVFDEDINLETEQCALKIRHATVQTMKISTEEKHVQAEVEQESVEGVQRQSDTNQNDAKNNQTSLHELMNRVKDIVKNCHIEEHEGETIFETLARQYVEANWKKEMLERKVTEISRELKQMAEMRDSLQMECDDNQTNIESLLLQIEHLKSNLPSIPEASEERVASLETETESMCEEIKRMQCEYEALRVKHFELITTMSILEGSLRNQENLEAEVRNTKQQLEIAKQQLDGVSKNAENNENMMEDLSRRLHASLEENNQLRKKIDALEIAEKQAQQQIRETKAENSEEISRLIERLEKELADVKRELNDSELNAQCLQNDLLVAVESRNELERDILAVSEEKEHLETELLLLHESESRKEDSDLLKNLREQLDMANREKNDLEYDILNMRKELDKALEQLEMAENRSDKLSFDNERLGKENNELLHELSSAHDESSERIELLQTEMFLLAQEHSSLKQDSEADKSELSRVQNDLKVSQSRLESLGADYEEIKARESRLVDLEEHAKSLEHQLGQANEKIQHLEIELMNLRIVEQESKLLREKCNWLEAQWQETQMVHSKIKVTEAKCHELEAALVALQSDRSNEQASKNESNSVIDELTKSQSKLELSLESAKENAAMARETIESLSQLVKEKDQEIVNLKSAAVVSTEKKHSEEEIALAALKAEREEFVRLVQEKHNTSLQYYAEIQRLAQMVTEQAACIQQITAERDEKISILTEKEAEILWAQNELQVVRQRLKSLEETQNCIERCGVVEHSVQIAQAAMLNEKCNALEAALIKEQSSNRIIQNLLTESQSRESNAAKELERLRTHLVEIEASYTEEALIAEENRKELEAKLLQAEEKVQNSSTVYTSASIRANQQVETLQQQISLIVQQRDEIQSKLSAAEDKVLSHTASLTNLQIVLEQFQRDKESDIRAATEKIRQQLNLSYKEQEQLRNEIVNLRAQLSEAKECLQAASRLSEQLDKKSERIEELNQEVTRLTDLVNTADQRMQEATSNEEGKVDKNLVKNLLIGFLSSSTTDKSSVLRVFATVLDFDETEREKSGLNNPTANGGWFSGLLGSGGSAPTKDQEASLSAAFVRFLESESKPKPQLPALTISNSPLTRPGHSRQHSSSSTQSGLLLSSVTLPSFPDFVPSRNTGSILKEVLKDS